ncbi:MAG: M13 family metallopeptidase [Sphingomonas sp.]
MKRSLAALLLSATILTGYSAHAASEAAAPALSPTTAVKPAFGDFGIDEAGMDKSIAPGADFYGYVNGIWAKNTPIPADKANYGAFDVLQDLSRSRTHDILEAARADPNSKIGAAYAAYLDTAAIEAKGLAPIKPLLDSIKSVTSKTDYVLLVAKANRLGIGTPFSATVTQDAKDPEHYALELDQDGLGLPDRDYYLDASPELTKARVAYQAHIAKMLTLANEPDADARARAIVAFETEIAKVSWTNIQNRDASKTYNKMSVAALSEAAPGFDFVAYFKGIGTPVDSVIVGQPSAVTGIAALIDKAPIAVLRDQLLVRSLDTYAAVLPAAFDNERFAMFGTVISGTPEQPARWKRAVDYTSRILTDDVSKLYVAKWFPPETKAAADAMVQNIIAAMNMRIDKLEWMSAQTKVKAHAKLAAFTPRIGYPSQWHDYTALKIVPGDAFGNAVRANQWEHSYDIAKLGKAIYRWEWGMTPMTVNAQADFGLVAITFPAAILQPPFFDPNADPAVNYGGIGAVIGHEMSHHFDDQGAKFDLHGQLIDWWTPADVAAFKLRTDALVKEYDAYEPLPGIHLKGALTLGENTADLTGLSAAYDAYHASLGGKPALVIDGYTGDQRFYLGWAQVWRRKYRDADMRNRLLTDPHAPAQQRAWIVRNLDPWYAAFQPKPGEKLYLTPEQRVRIW